MTDDNEEKPKTGYKNPPAEHRFKQGQSGNPKGAKKLAPWEKARISKRMLNQAVLDEAARVITVTEKGKPKKMDMISYIVRSQAAHAAKDFRSTRLFLRLVAEAEKSLPAPKEDPSLVTYDLTKLKTKELEVLRDLLEKCRPD